MADLFLSYARPDRAKIESLALALEARGYSVWWDRHIEGGADFSADIEHQLMIAKVVVVLWSEASRKSSWVKDEADVGREKGKLVALSLDAELPPLGFRQYHAIDFSGWEESADSEAFESLLTAVESCISGRPVSPPNDPRFGASKTPSLRSFWKWAAALSFVALAYFAFDSQQARQPDAPSPVDALPVAVDTPWITVSAVKPGLGSEGVADMASALSEGIANGLSRFSWLRVAAVAPDGNPAGANAAYRLEGSLRQTGDVLRLTMQLIKTSTGEQVWGSSYDRQLNRENAIAVQDALTANVVAAVADPSGALVRDLSAPVALKPIESMTPYEAVLRHMVYRQRVSPEDHAVAMEALQRAVRLAPEDADAWAALAAMYSDEFKHNFNQQPAALDMALEAARRALTLDSDNAFATFLLAEIHYFRQDLGAFRAAAEKSVALNPFDSDSMAMIGILRSFSGEWERGAHLARKAMSLNPNHPGWYHMGIVFDELRRSEFHAALATAKRIDMPQFHSDALVRTLSHAYLGQMREARQAAQEFLALWPDQDLDYFRRVQLDRWFFASPELITLSVQGLEMAGLQFD